MSPAIPSWGPIRRGRLKPSATACGFLTIAAARWTNSGPATRSRCSKQHLRGYRAPALPGLPRFLGGAVGYAAYDTVRYTERLPNAPPDDRGLPDLLFDIYETMVVFDHVRKVVAGRRPRERAGGGGRHRAARAYEQAAELIDGIIDRLRRPSALQPVRVALPAPPLERYASNFTPAEFAAVVERCKEYIRAGDIFQVVPSQRLPSRRRPTRSTSTARCG